MRSPHINQCLKIIMFSIKLHGWNRLEQHINNISKCWTTYLHWLQTCINSNINICSIHIETYYTISKYNLVCIHTYIYIYANYTYIYIVYWVVLRVIFPPGSLLFTPLLRCHIYNTSGAHTHVQYVLSRFIVFKILILWYYSCSQCMLFNISKYE